jgi:hypothetical protein
MVIKEERESRQGAILTCRLMIVFWLTGSQFSRGREHTGIYCSTAPQPLSHGSKVIELHFRI